MALIDFQLTSANILSASQHMVRQNTTYYPQDRSDNKEILLKFLILVLLSQFMNSALGYNLSLLE